MKAFKDLLLALFILVALAMVSGAVYHSYKKVTVNYSSVNLNGKVFSLTCDTIYVGKDYSYSTNEVEVILIEDDFTKNRVAVYPAYTNKEGIVTFPRYLINSTLKKLKQSNSQLIISTLTDKGTLIETISFSLKDVELSTCKPL